MCHILYHKHTIVYSYSDMYAHYHNTSNNSINETENEDANSDACFPGLNKIEVYYIFLVSERVILQLL